MKYAALVLNVVAMLLLGWAFYGVMQLARAHTMPARPPVLELPVLPPELVQEQLKISEAFDALSSIQAQTAETDISGQSLIALPAPGRPIEGSMQMPERSLSVYLEEIGTQAESVVIDGHLLKKGSLLHEGGRIIQVRPNEVLISEHVGRQKLALPIGELRVGTLRWPDGSLASDNQQEFNPGLTGVSPAPAGRVP